LKLANRPRRRTVKGGSRVYVERLTASYKDRVKNSCGVTSVRRSAIRYSVNRAVLHDDESLMPKRRAVWSSWNYLGERREANCASQLCVTCWMNRLQPLATDRQFFVTLNPRHFTQPGKVLHTQTYTHPVSDGRALQSQRQLWQLQGERNTWYCGAYFGAGFHEDGLQSGLAVAEDLGGVHRPWTVENESSRICRAPLTNRIGVAA
jgi:predicted NAD/FAD-binding protein